MALPVSPAPKSDDVAVLGWSGLTVRIAWTLLARGVRVRPEVLKDARTHVLLHLDPHTPLPHAEDLAASLTSGFVDRARGRPLSDPWPVDVSMPLSPRWRRALEHTITTENVSRLVFRKHYGDGRSLEHIEKRTRIDRLHLEGARAGLREVVRRAAAADGLPLENWPPERIDRLLVRLAAFSPGPCPPILDVAEGGYQDHVGTCVRCDRAVRLLRAGILTVDDLLPPTLGARPTGRVRVLALHFHPEGRRHRRLLRDELGVDTFPVEDDLLLVDFARPDEVESALRMAAELGMPHRDHLRGALLEAPGAWTRHGLVGPMVERARQELKHRIWSVVEGVDELPDPLPPPPSARSLWSTAGGLSLLTVLLARLALSPADAAIAETLSVDFSEGRGGIWTAFDLPETSLLTVVREQDGALEVVHASRTPADKMPFAVGDGSWRLHVPGDAVMIIASDRPVHLGPLLSDAAGSPDPMSRLGELLAATPVEWRLHRR